MRSRPLVVASLTAGRDFERSLARGRRSGADIVEIRLDSFAALTLHLDVVRLFVRDLVRTVRRATGRPVLATCRWFLESGQKARPTLNERRRVEVLRAAIPEADLVDLEIRNVRATRELTGFAQRNGVSVIHSFHQFNGSPAPAALRRLADSSRKMGGDFFKAAVRTATPADLERFLDAGARLPHPRPILIGMGAAGLPSRILGFSFGSRLTYGHLGRRAAPGQLPVEHLVRSVRAVYKPS